MSIGNINQQLKQDDWFGSRQKTDAPRSDCHTAKTGHTPCDRVTIQQNS